MAVTLARAPRREVPTVASTTLALRRRLLGRPRSAQEKLWAWVAPALITVVAGILRFWDLGRPHQLIFDETYYVKQGWSQMLYGYPRAAPKSIKTPDALFTMGNFHIYGSQPDFVVHPPGGKWLIGFGEHLFGINSSFGWRFAVACCGTVAVYLVGRAAWHLFRSALLAGLASLLLCFEGEAFVMSRTGILDEMVMFWALAAFVAILADRDRTRGILAAKVARMRVAGTWAEHDVAGPWLGIRPWRIVAGLCLGADLGSKWSGGYFLVAFGLMTVWWDLGARRAVGARHWISATFLKDALQALVTMVGLTMVVYLTTWAGWFASTGAYDRNWAANNPAVGPGGIYPNSSWFAWLPGSMRSLWEYQIQMYQSAASITATHPYMSNPWSWMLQTRPTSFFYESPTRGHDGCTVANCSKAITSLGTPTIWWVGTVALAVLLFHWLLRRDWRAGAILGGVAAGWLPWFAYQHRTIFTFYTVAFSPYVVLASVFVCGLALGPAAATVRRRRLGAAAVGAFTVATVLCFIFFWPIWTAQVIPYTHWQWRMWFPSWV